MDSPSTSLWENFKDIANKTSVTLAPTNMEQNSTQNYLPREWLKKLLLTNAWPSCVENRNIEKSNWIEDLEPDLHVYNLCWHYIMSYYNTVPTNVTE